MSHDADNDSQGGSLNYNCVLEVLASGVPVAPPPVVSIITTMRNAGLFLQETLDSILTQATSVPLEFSIFDDASQDNSVEILRAAVPRFVSRGIRVVLSALVPGEMTPRGVGFGKNRAVERCSGEYLCFLDADDVMMPERIEEQLRTARSFTVPEKVLVGSNFVRTPEGSTARYTDWCNSLTEEELWTRRFCECTVVMPTWFCHRDVFTRAGGFSETGRGTPEDLIFFYGHLDGGGQLSKVPRPLLTYRYHQTSASHSVDRWTIWDVRIRAIQANLLDHLGSFTIWNAGEGGDLLRVFVRLCLTLRSVVRKRRPEILQVPVPGQPGQGGGPL